MDPASYVAVHSIPSQVRNANTTYGVLWGDRITDLKNQQCISTYVPQNFLFESYDTVDLVRSLTCAARYAIPVFVGVALCMAAANSASELRQARVLIDRSEFNQALAVLDRAKKEDGQNERVLYLRGYVLYRLGRLAEAKQELENTIHLTPPNLQSRYILGRIAQTEDQPIVAIRWFEPCARVTPPVQDARARISKLYWDTGQIEQARTWTEQAIQDTPWDGSLHYRLGRIYQQSGKLDLARKEFEESAKAKTADSEGVRKLMDCSKALSSGDMATAFRVRDEFLNAPTLDPDLLVALGTSFAESGAPEEGLRLFEAAAARDSGSFQAQFNIGLAKLNMQRPTEAVQPLEASLRRAPESKQANSALALAHVLQNDFDAAVPPLEAAREADPHDRKTTGLLALAYYRTGAAAKAIPLLQESLKQSKDDPKVYFLLIDCFNATERQQEALVTANKAAERFPGLAKTWLAKAQQLARLGKYHEAGPFFAKAIELDPQQIDALLGLAEAQQKDGDYQAALDTYQRAQAKDGDVTAELGAARSLIFLGRMQEARSVLEQSAAANSNNSQVHFELSRVYARLGESERAAEQVRIVQQLRSQDNEASKVRNPPQ